MLTPLLPRPRVTNYGKVYLFPDGTTMVDAIQDQLQAWARRPADRWPCSTLAQCSEICAYFDASGDLVDIEEPTDSDVDGHELSAWVSDVLRLAGCSDHPAIHS